MAVRDNRKAGNDAQTATALPHATRTLGRSENAGGTALRVEAVPPLSRATSRIEVITTGRSAEARARLPLHWE